MKNERILYNLGKVDDKYIIEAAPEKKPVKKHISVKWGIIAACLCIAVMSVGIGSMASAGALNKSFGQLFHTLSESNYEDMLFDINKSATHNGVTVTLTQGMCDGKALYAIEKIEFDPSVLTLTEDMFADGNCPNWEISNVIDVKKTAALPKEDLAVDMAVEMVGGIHQVIEHNKHSMTVLLIYGGDDIVDTDSNFFEDNTEFTVHQRNVQPSSFNGDKNYIECSFDLTFNIKRSEPNYYTLPEEIYQTDYYNEALDKSLADVTINPWFVYFSSGTGTGKILDTSLKSDDKPSLEITLNDGTVYTEEKGIHIHKDYFGKDYDQTDFIECDFDTPIDVANIKSIKVYGHELKKGIVAPGKERVMSEDRGKLHLPANSPVEFSNKFAQVDVVDYEGSSGKIKYRVNSVEIYDNIFATGADKSIVDFERLERVKFSNIKYDDKGKLIKSDYSGTYDSKTGRLAKGYYILEFEVEVTNIDANNMFSGGTFDYANTYIFNKFFSACQYDRYSTRTNKMVGIPMVYLKEDEVKRTQQYGDFRLKKGQTRKLHLGFLMTDNNAGGPEQIALSVGWGSSADMEEYKTIDYTYFNATKIIEEFENRKEK